MTPFVCLYSFSCKINGSKLLLWWSNWFIVDDRVQIFSHNFHHQWSYISSFLPIIALKYFCWWLVPVLYADGDEEKLNLKRQRWELIKDDSFPVQVGLLPHSVLHIFLFLYVLELFQRSNLSGLHAIVLIMFAGAGDWCSKSCYFIWRVSLVIIFLQSFINKTIITWFSHSL